MAAILNLSKGWDMLIGRRREIERLEKVYCSKEAEFVVIYGRRRIGKTFLIREFFSSKKCIFFQATGLQKGKLSLQLQNFIEAVSRDLNSNIPIKVPNTWREAFSTLDNIINTRNSKHKTVIFLDELPWMATRKSGLLEMIDYYWNQYWSRNSNIILVVCGSNASWLIKRIIYNTGGLHNRCTAEIQLEPFNLSETRLFLRSKGIKLNNNHILDLYMALGGVPYYLNNVSGNLTAAENIQNILFSQHAPLKGEFTKLFDSLFKNAAIYIDLIKIIAQKREGITRIELENKISKAGAGGRLSQRLTQLEQASFISSQVSWNKQRGEFYKVIDEFCLFYLSWLDKKQLKNLAPNHWLQQAQKSSFHAWAGYAFEAVCHKHITQIIRALHINTAESIDSWRYVAGNEQEKGAQIDLLIDRSDDAVTLCEIKYTGSPFVITKEYSDILKNKIRLFETTTKTSKQIFMTIISANGIKHNQYSNELLSGVVELSDLLRD